MINKELQEQFCEFLVKNIGLYYPKSRWRDLEKKLVLIKSSFGFEDIVPCLEWLMNQPISREKLDILTSHLTIGETYFFRDNHLFACLEQNIIPDILRRRHSERRIRILSAGCCTGEEPYSIAMLLHRIIPNLKDWNISILGTDINQEFIDKAEKACYKKWSFRNTPPKVLERYFKLNSDSSYTLIPEIRKMVNFKHLNLVEDTYPDLTKGINEMNLICCHNVLIYFSENQIKKTIYQLAKTLTNNGWLSVSAIEVPFIHETSLNSYKYPGVVFFKKESLKQSEGFQKLPVNVVKKIATQPSPTVLSNELTDKNKKTIFEESHQFYAQKAYREVIDLLLPILLPFQNEQSKLGSHINEVILLVRSYANQGDLIHALEWTERALKADKLHPMLHYLHAILLQAKGNLLEAIKSLKRALFNEPNFIMAYFMLGMFEKEQGNKKNAARSFKTALKLMEQLPSDPLLGAEEFSVEYLKEMINANLNNLKGFG